MTATLLRANTRALPLAADSVDLIVTSPPYFALRSYTDGGDHYAGQLGSEATPAEYVAALIECTREWMRVLKPTGSIWVNLGDKYAGSPSVPAGSSSQTFDGRESVANWTRRGTRVSHGVRQKSLMGLPWRYALACIDELGLILRAEVIWSKPNGLPESVTDRVRRSHEQWFHFTLQPRYFANVDEIREPHVSGQHGQTRSERTDRRASTEMRWGHRVDKHTQLPPQPGDPSAFHALGKLPGSVWSIASQPLKVPAELGVDHFAAFPMEWPQRIILGWSPPHGVVLDPFGGTGTTALVASTLGRRGISVDMSADYCRLAAWRTTDPKQIERASRSAPTKTPEIVREETVDETSDRHVIRVGSLCTGFGGIELGLRLAGLDFTTAWYAEVEPALIDPLRDIWHPGVPNIGDVTKVDWSAVAPVDLIVGGIPCQPTSAAGKRLGDADPRWLWPYARDAVDVLRPARFLLENVRGLVSHDKGRLFDGICTDLNALGYDVRWLTLGACAVGLAHHRHRVFLLATRTTATPTTARLNTTECGVPRGGRQLLITPTARDYKGDQAEHRGRSKGSGTLGESLTLLPTPAAQSYGSNQGGARPDGRASDEPDRLAALKLLPSPQARDGQGRGTPSVETATSRFEAGRRNIDDALALLPTPTSTDARGSRNATSGRAPDSAHHAGETLTDAFWLLPTPRASDGVNGGPNQAGRRGDLALPSAVQPERWGRFTEAVQRHADAIGTLPPEPTEPNKNGNPRLRPAFVEWLMGVPAGHVTDHLDRRSTLKALGNGVVPLQLTTAWRQLTDQLPTNYGQRANTSTPTKTGDRMSTTEEVRLMLERKDQARRDVLVTAQDATNDLGPYDAGHYRRMAKALHAAALVIAATWRAEAIGYEGSTKRDQSAKVRQRLRDSAAELVGFTAGLIAPAFLESLDKVDDSAAPESKIWTCPRGCGYHIADGPIGDDEVSTNVLISEHMEEHALQDQYPSGSAASQSANEAHESEWYGTVRECKIGGHACSHDDATNEWYPVVPNTSGGCSTAGCQPGEPWQDSPTIVTPPAVASDTQAIQAYLKGDTDVIPTALSTRIAVTNPVLQTVGAPVAGGPITSIVFVDPAPIAPPRMSWAEFAAEVANLPIPDHGSFSAITSLADCGMAYALDKMAKAKIGNVKPQLPAWYLVGGQAFHAATEGIERVVMTDGNLASDFDAGPLWLNVFAAEIKKTEQESGVSQALWRAADKGRENYDWWRVQGEDMLRRYVQYHNPEWRRTHQILVMPDGRPALELKLTLDLAGWPFECVIDQVWQTERGLYIDDLKSGKTKQPSTFQLGGYAHALADELGIDSRLGIAGGFYDARAGSHDMEVDDLLAAHPLVELKYRAHAARAQVQQRAYLPRVSNFGGGCTSCGHRAICPAQS